MVAIFRSPIHLNVGMLVPLAKTQGIEVMADVILSEKDTGRRNGNGGFKAGLPIVGNIELAGSADYESEVTQSRTIKDHPASALNRLIETLQSNDGLRSLDDEIVQKGEVVEINDEWEISQATDIGSMIQSIMKLLLDQPSLLTGGTLPVQAIAGIMTGSSDAGTVVLQAANPDGQDRTVLVLLSPDDVLSKNVVDDLEGDRTVLGVVHELVPEGRSYSLKKVFLAGFNRTVRRSIDLSSLSDAVAPLGRPIADEDITIPGPVVVIQAVAVY